MIYMSDRFTSAYNQYAVDYWQAREVRQPLTWDEFVIDCIEHFEAEIIDLIKEQIKYN